jgi:hypothetical protein
MAITDSGKNRIRDLLLADINSGKLGTDSTDPTATDTALGAVDATTSATPTNTTGNKTINSTHILLSTIGNGTTYKEFGTFVNSGATLLNRVVFPDFAKNSSVELHTTTVIRVD